MGESAISRYETGKVIQSRDDALHRLARALSVSVSELRGDRAPYEGNDLRHPELQPLRDAVNRLQPLGAQVLATFALRAARLAERFAKRPRS